MKDDVPVIVGRRITAGGRSPVEKLHYTVNCCPCTCMKLKVEHRQNDLSLEKIKKKGKKIKANNSSRVGGKKWGFKFRISE